jgi:hypothetical protein
MDRNGRIALITGSVLLLLLVVMSAICLVKYAGWSAVVSGYYGLPSHGQLVARASLLATRWLWGMAAGEIGATVVLLALLPSRLGPLRFIAAVMGVVIGIIAYLLVIIGHHFR